MNRFRAGISYRCVPPPARFVMLTDAEAADGEQVVAAQETPLP